MQKNNLPNIVGGINFVEEYKKYVELYEKIDRTQTGQLSYTAPSSGTVYDTLTYPSDLDVYNRGEEGLATLLYKYVLKDYIIDSEFIGELNTLISDLQSSLVTFQRVYDVTVSYLNNTYTVESGLPSEITVDSNIIYKIRFKSPVNSALNDSIKLSPNKTPVAIKMINGGGIKENTWAQNSYVELSVISPTTIQLEGGGGSGGGIYVGNVAPVDTSLLWIDTTNSANVAKFYDAATSTWKTVVGTFG